MPVSPPSHPTVYWEQQQHTVQSKTTHEGKEAQKTLDIVHIADDIGERR
jgi:hypothetical protein